MGLGGKGEGAFSGCLVLARFDIQCIPASHSYIKISARFNKMDHASFTLINIILLLYAACIHACTNVYTCMYMYMYMYVPQFHNIVSDLHDVRLQLLL